MNISSLSNKFRNRKKIFLAIGIFDGVHKGHKKVLSKMIAKARKEKIESAVLTFTPHPYAVLHPDKKPPMLLSLEHRLKLLSESGADHVYVINFTKNFAVMSAVEFIKKYLMGALNVSEIFVGKNFRIGHGRLTGIDNFARMCGKYGIRVNVIDDEKIDGKRISSTRIRKKVISGKLREACKLLGRKFSVLGTVVHGFRRGVELGFPTANMDVHNEAIPPSGVYAVFVKVNQKIYKGVLNIGFCPTFRRKNMQKTFEVYIFDFHKDIYGRDIEVEIVKFLRKERRFKYKKNLTKQIKNDVDRARIILAYTNIIC